MVFNNNQIFSIKESKPKMHHNRTATKATPPRHQATKMTLMQT